MSTQRYVVQLDHRLEVKISNLSVSVMNIADVTVVVTVLANFQNQFVLDLQGYMEYGEQINLDLDVQNV